MPGTVPSTPADEAIARVQASGAGEAFGFFPNGQTSAPLGCRIPGPRGRGIRGRCQSRATIRGTGGTRTALVTFTESWPARRFRRGGSPQRTLRHSWRFEVEADGRVVALGDEGDFPPQAAE